MLPPKHPISTEQKSLTVNEVGKKEVGTGRGSWVPEAWSPAVPSHYCISSLSQLDLSCKGYMFSNITAMLP